MLSGLIIQYSSMLYQIKLLFRPYLGTVTDCKPHTKACLLFLVKTFLNDLRPQPVLCCCLHRSSVRCLLWMSWRTSNASPSGTFIGGGASLLRNNWQNQILASAVCVTMHFLVHWFNLPPFYRVSERLVMCVSDLSDVSFRGFFCSCCLVCRRWFCVDV